MYWDDSIGDGGDYAYAIVYASLVPFFDCLKYSIIKMYDNEYPAFDLAIDSTLLETGLEIFILISWIVGADQISLIDFAWGALAGLCLHTSRICIGTSIVIGCMGQAIYGNYTMFIPILDYLAF